MFEFSIDPITDAEFWALVGAAIVTLALASVAMVGLWTLFGPEPPDNYQSPSIRDNVRRVK